jgi:benzoyl-CoA reductase subunit B
MGQPFERTMELVNGLIKPGAQLLQASQDEVARLQGATLGNIVERFEDIAEATENENRKVALYEFGLTPQLFYAFDCAPLCLESYPNLFTGVKKEVLHDFIAAAEEAGAPSDVCSTDRFILGAALRGEFPENAFFVTGSSPCDGTRLVYPIMEKLLEIPTLYIEAPYTYEREAASWYAKQIKMQLIPFLEEATGVKFDIDRFREVIEESNRAYELILEICDTHTLKPCPTPQVLRGAPYAGFISSAGHPRHTQTMELLHESSIRWAKEGNPQANYHEKYRVLWVHVPPTFDGSIFSWMEKELGASILGSSLTTTPILKPIDTTDLETMLEGYAWQGLDMTMSIMRFETPVLWEFTIKTYDRLQCDCMIITQHVGCNSICGAAGLLRGYLREREIPALFLEFDYNDDRVLSSESLRVQIEEFFTTVME